NLIVLEEGSVCHQRPVPTPRPSLVQGKLAGRFHRTAEIAIAGGSRAKGTQEVVLVLLLDAVGANLIGAVDQSLPEFTLQQQPLLRGNPRRDGGVVVGRDRPVVRNLEPEAGA